MKYIKTYEDSKKRLRIGDYVICHTNAGYVHNSEKTRHFINNNVGQYVRYSKGYDLQYGIKYENIPPTITRNLDEGLLWFERDEIFDFSKNKEELELKIMAKKYNL